MKPQPDFEQWTDQNHVPYCGGLSGKNLEITTSSHRQNIFKMLWHNIARFVTPQHHSGIVSGAKKPGTIH